MGDDYYDDDDAEDFGERELDDDYYATEIDLKIISASPEDETGAPSNKPDQEPKDEQKRMSDILPTMRLFQLTGKESGERFWKETFEEVVRIIFSEFAIDAQLGAKIIHYSHHSDDSDMKDSDEEEALRHISRVQMGILDVFGWAISNDVRDLELILEEVRGSVSTPVDLSASEFMYRSNGASAVWRTYFDYEGSSDDGASLRDGYSIQSASLAMRRNWYD